ncbi:putative uncharacterized protein DDB_G0287113 [Cebidichthys violaceus]|uniref:putative uncharacterized protein DDB_G0287113 n=1 Tax=Cebidichthys violaceus TaxID=271503 RepID=UPI0035CB4533
MIHIPANGFTLLVGLKMTAVSEFQPTTRIHGGAMHRTWHQKGEATLYRIQFTEDKQVFNSVQSPSTPPPAAMAKRKSKKPQEDTSILLESSVSQSRSKINSHSSPALLFIIIFTIGASLMGWFCLQQQQSLDQLSESFTTMQKRITNLQQVVAVTQTDTGLGVEERIFALEEAQKEAQEKVEVALATSEKLKNADYAQLWTLHEEMDTRLTETKQVALSVTTLQAMFNNQSEEFEAMKESVVASLSSSSALAENVDGLTSAVVSACSRVDDQAALVSSLNAQLEGQASDLNELKESMYLHKDALHTNNQEMAGIKELVEAKQAMRAQALEEMFSSVQMTLDEQYSTSQTLRSSLMTQLQTFHSQLAKTPLSMKVKSNEEGSAAEEFVSTTTQSATEVQEKLEDVEEKDEQQDTEDEAENEAEEEEGEAMQEEQPLEQEVEEGVIEEQEEEAITEEEEEEITPEEQEDEENTEQSEEQAVAEEAAEEEVAEQTVDGHVLDQPLEEEVSEEVGETVVEDSGELNREVFMEENEEDV